MRAYVGITDKDWFDLLRSQPGIDEVNFWKPGGTAGFSAINVGEPFLFKLHHPYSYIVGGGFFTYFSRLPMSLAWEAFGVKNGARTFDEMRRRIVRYRRTSAETREDFSIGCIILAQPFFFDERDWIAAPASFHSNIVQGKRYDLEHEEGLALWDAVRVSLVSSPARVAERAVEPAMFGEPVPVRRRLGQGAFRVLVTDTYERRCAVTREKTLPVLEAAHIRPVTGGGKHAVENGLLLRSDVHTLFDRGYVTVDPTGQFRVSPRLKQDFDNGAHYYQMAGSSIWLPSGAEQRPSREALEWHADTVFLG